MTTKVYFPILCVRFLVFFRFETKNFQKVCKKINYQFGCETCKLPKTTVSRRVDINPPSIR